jgi:dTMP kinase
MSPSAEALLYAAARAELVASQIQPALAVGRVVLADRFVHSSIAYQGAGRGLGEQRVRDANELATAGTLPELVLLLRLDVDDAEARLAAAREATGEPADRLEQAGRDFFQRVANSYDQLASDEAGRFAVVDATRTVDDIQLAIRDLVGNTLSAAGAT